jgi:hypothetical protein
MVTWVWIRWIKCFIETIVIANFQKVNWHPNVGQEALGWGCGCVWEMGVSWKVWSWIIVRVDKMEGGKNFTCALSRGLGKCRVRASHYTKGWRLVRGTYGGSWKGKWVMGITRFDETWWNKKYETLCAYEKLQ